MSVARYSWAALLLFPLALSAHGATITGADYADTDLTPANGDTLSGIFTNVRLFQVGAGSTVFVAPSVSLTIYASTISISGTLNGGGRGQAGGNGGAASAAGLNGFAADTGGSGAGTGGAPSGAASAKGGGGGAGAGAGGNGAGSGGGTGGAAYGSTGTVTGPISADDLFQGSGGGGGGGNGSIEGGNGAAGGAAIYLEASSVSISGSVLIDGSTASPVVFSQNSFNPGGGGGGGGGSLILRVPGNINLFAGSKLSAKGGGGGSVSNFFFPAQTVSPGGGGAGGRIKIFYRPGTDFTVSLSTFAGAAGTNGGSGTLDAAAPQPGSEGTVSYGVIATPPANFAAAQVNISSISWGWTATASFGDAPGAQSYRIFPSTVTLPLPSAEAAVASTSLNAAVTGLIPNTTYFRFVTAFTAWGDSLPSNSVSTHTLANTPTPGSPIFSDMADTGMTLNWDAGSPTNPSYTLYEINRAADVNFSAALSTNFVTTLSSAPAALTPNTTYYFRARAINLDGIPTPFTAVFATATLAVVPANAVFSRVNVTSVSLSWATGSNPVDTSYLAQTSTDPAFSSITSSGSLGPSTTFYGLTPGSQYFFRIEAINRNGIASPFTTIISTKPGILSDISLPTPPGVPQPDRQFSYDGTIIFTWAAAQGGSGIFDYNFTIGSFPEGKDVLSSSSISGLSYAASGLANGRKYYARVQARSLAGILGNFSESSQGVPVFIAAQSAALNKPINWPNPFDPRQGSTQIGFSLDEAAEVVLKIYTLQGRLVYEESKGFSGSGNQVMTWNGANDSGIRVAPGGYVATLQKRYWDRSQIQKFKIALLY